MGGRVSASAAIKTRSRKIPYLVVFIKNSHSGTQQKCCTSACTHASSENKTCSPQIVFTFLSAWHCQGHAEQTGPRRRAWQVRRPIQYNCRNSSRGMEVVFRSSQQQQQYSRSVATRNASVMQTFFFFIILFSTAKCWVTTKALGWRSYFLNHVSLISPRTISLQCSNLSADDLSVLLLSGKMVCPFGGNEHQ